MLEVSNYVAKIRDAKYGLEVRESIAAGIEAIDRVAEGQKESAKIYMEQAKEQAESAKLAANRAEELAAGLDTIADLLDGINGEVV